MHLVTKCHLINEIIVDILDNMIDRKYVLIHNT